MNQLESEVLMGMRLEDVENGGATTRISATGCESLLDGEGLLRCVQRIPVRREVARIRLPGDALPLRLREKNDFACHLTGPGLGLTFQGDSLVILNADRDLQISVEGLFRPLYHAHKDGKRLFIDATGGFGVYPVREQQTMSPDLDHSPWRTNYRLAKGDQLWVSIFPPRRYNWEHAFQSIAHEGGMGCAAQEQGEYFYPGEDLIRSAARYCKIFAVHSHIWPGGQKPPWLIPQFVPSDMAAFNAMRDSIHRNGMKCLLYFSPYYYRGADFDSEMRRALDDYKVDGLYFDGISDDFRTSYRMIRRARRTLGSAILYVHCSTDPLYSGLIYCPFIDTYADYLLRGEAGRKGLARDDFLRWVCSGYNISNAVGYWCYYGSTDRSGYVYQTPTSDDITAALASEARVWRTEEAWKRHGQDVDAFDKEYYAKLEEIRLKHLSGTVAQRNGHGGRPLTSFDGGEAPYAHEEL